MASSPDTSNGFSMTPDQIFITDVGTDRREKAFYWIVLGRHVYDHIFNEITMRDLEREIDPNDVMNPVILRGNLWKTVPTRLWQIDDGHQLGPMPSHPGLDANFSSVYYGNRRARQSVQFQQPAQIHAATVSTGLNCNVPANTNNKSLPSQRSHMRRTRSLDTVTDEAKLARDYGLRRRWSVDGPYVVEDLEPEIPADEIEGDDAAECEGNLDMTDFEWFRRWHTRKASAGIDSGVDVGSVDEGPSVALKRDSEPLAE